MKRRRIDFYSKTEQFIGKLVEVLAETRDYFIIYVPTISPEFDRIRTCFTSGQSFGGKTEKEYRRSLLQWKPHEYRQEARQSCLYAYWFLKRRLGKDPAGIIAKYVWSTRFEEIWEAM